MDFIQSVMTEMSCVHNITYWHEADMKQTQTQSELHAGCRLSELEVPPRKKHGGGFGTRQRSLQAGPWISAVDVCLSVSLWCYSRLWRMDCRPDKAHHTDLSRWDYKSDPGGWMFPQCGYRLIARFRFSLFPQQRVCCWKNKVLIRDQFNLLGCFTV